MTTPEDIERAIERAAEAFMLDSFNVTPEATLERFRTDVASMYDVPIERVEVVIEGRHLTATILAEIPVRLVPSTCGMCGRGEADGAGVVINLVCGDCRRVWG